MNGNWRMTFTFEGENAVLVDYQDDHQERTMSRMHNPPHPGEVLREWLPEDMTVTQAAKALQISRVMLSKVLNARAGVTASMALRLAAWLGTSPELWLGMQTQFDLWQAEQQPAPAIQPLERRAA
nr:HigA family addiction module antitoxin [Thauera chlorobenzoica]